jgi:dienelactone hydrolase
MGTGGQKSGDAGAGGKATGGVAGAASGGAGGSGGAVGPTLPPITDYTAKGPFATKQESNVGPGGKYTVYRPDPLGKDGFVHAPIVFGPGIGQQVTVHNQMLTNFASHGFIVVGTPVLNGGPGDAANLKSMQDGLAWILQQNGVAGTYQGKVWVDHAISMGFSVGGTSAVQLGGEQAVATVVSIHGHNASAALHGPMLQTTGTNDTVGMPLQKQTYDKSMVQTFLATLTGAPHQYIESNGGGEERPAILAWMRYWIYRDEGAKKYFFGSDCVLCKAPWENPQRKNWP